MFIVKTPKLPNAELKPSSTTFYSGARCFKTFYNCNLPVFVKARMFVHGKSSQPSLMFVGKTEA